MEKLRNKIKKEKREIHKDRKQEKEKCKHGRKMIRETKCVKNYRKTERGEK